MKKILPLLFIVSLIFTGCGLDLGAEKIQQTNTLSQKLALSELKSKYTTDGATLKMTAKDNPKDKIEVTIGNESKLLGADSDFEPKVKIARWDDEVSFSISPKGLDEVKSKNKKLSLEKDKVKFSTPKKDYSLYDLPVSDELPEGGFEYQIDLLEKPDTNVMEFDLETKGLDFFYQPEIEDSEITKDSKEKLTTKQILEKKREMRPENVVGSYAVYASEDKINYVGGKEYKTGKVGHIYRPQIEDAEGNKVWGQLNVDTDKGILSVTIPQDFLDDAVYPVRHATGLTFGYTSIGGTDDYGVDNYYNSATDGYDVILGNKFTLSTAGNISSISSYFATYDSSMYVRVGISGTDLNLDEDSDSIQKSNVDFGWQTMSLQSSFSASTNDYWLLIFSNIGGEIKYKYDSGLTSQNLYEYENYTNGYPATLVPDSYRDRKYSIYATYTADTAETHGCGNWALHIIDGATLSAKSFNSTSTDICVESGSSIKLWESQ